MGGVGETVVSHGARSRSVKDPGEERASLPSQQCAITSTEGHLPLLVRIPVRLSSHLPFVPLFGLAGHVTNLYVRSRQSKCIYLLHIPLVLCYIYT